MSQSSPASEIASRTRVRRSANSSLEKLFLDKSPPFCQTGDVAPAIAIRSEHGAADASGRSRLRSVHDDLGSPPDRRPSQNANRRYNYPSAPRSAPPGQVN